MNFNDQKEVLILFESEGTELIVYDPFCCMKIKCAN